MFHSRTRLLASGAVAVCVALTTAGCPVITPQPTTFKIKLSNWGDFPVVGAYLLARADRVGDDPEAEDWGENLVPAALLNGLEPDCHVMLGDDFPLGEYHLRVDFWVEASKQEGTIISKYYFPSSPQDDGFVSPSAVEDGYTTWHSHRTVSQTGSSTGTGWSPGIPVFEGERNVTP